MNADEEFEELLLMFTFKNYCENMHNSSFLYGLQSDPLPCD